jgi:hypothetical protein
MTDQPSAEALEAARKAVTPQGLYIGLRGDVIHQVALALDAFAAKQLATWIGDEPTPCRRNRQGNCATILACHLTCQRFAGSADGLVPDYADLKAENEQVREANAMWAKKCENMFVEITTLKTEATGQRKSGWDAAIEKLREYNGTKGSWGNTPADWLDANRPDGMKQMRKLAL